MAGSSASIIRAWTRSTGDWLLPAHAEYSALSAAQCPGPSLPSYPQCAFSAPTAAEAPPAPQATASANVTTRTIFKFPPALGEKEEHCAAPGEHPGAVCGSGLLLRLRALRRARRRRRHSELLHPRHVVLRAPVFGDLAVLEPYQVEAVDAERLAGRLHAHELALHRARHGAVDPNLVAVGGDVVHGHLQVGEPRVHSGDQRLQAFAAGRHAGHRLVVDERIGEQRVHFRGVASRHLIHERLDEGLVGLTLWVRGGGVLGTGAVGLALTAGRERRDHHGGG